MLCPAPLGEYPEGVFFSGAQFYTVFCPHPPFPALIIIDRTRVLLIPVMMGTGESERVMTVRNIFSGKPPAPPDTIKSSKALTATIIRYTEMKSALFPLKAQTAIFPRQGAGQVRILRVSQDALVHGQNG